MKIAIDITPIQGEQKGHKVRGVGFYLEYLKRALLEYYPENEYTFFTQKEKIKKAVDIVHYPYFEPFFMTLPLFEKYKRIVTVHDLTPIVFPQYFPAGIKGNFRWKSQRRRLKRSAGIITDSVASENDIIKYAHIKKDKITVAHLAAADEFRILEKGKWSDEIIEKYKLPEKFVLYVGDVTWNKNLPLLIEAIKEINLTLVMVGKSLVSTDFDRTNPWNRDLVQVHQLIRDDKRFIRLGFVPTADLVALYNLASVFVFPSVYEGFGLPILEAMQSGCPVVTTKESSLPEVAGDAALYVDGYAIHGIANGIGEVFFTKKLQEDLIKKGVDQAKKFSWKKTAGLTLEAYKKAITSS